VCHWPSMFSTRGLISVRSLPIDAETAAAGPFAKSRKQAGAGDARTRFVPIGQSIGDLRHATARSALEYLSAQGIRQDGFGGYTSSAGGGHSMTREVSTGWLVYRRMDEGSKSSDNVDLPLAPRQISSCFRMVRTISTSATAATREFLRVGSN